jgi:selT/selW/selH-like putative selenoprotein
LTVISRAGYGSKFRACATAIERAFPEIEVLGNAKGKPRSGAFEVSSEDGVVFWSKLGTSSISSVAFPSLATNPQFQYSMLEQEALDSLIPRSWSPS